MNFKTVQENRKKWWNEIESLEQQHEINMGQVEKLEQRQTHISNQIKELIDKIESEGQKYNEFCYKNGIGEFKK